MLNKGSLIQPAMLFGFVLSSSVFAATPVNLAHQPISGLNSSSYQELSRSIDQNNTLHVRVQQMYAGHAVWGADAVMHIPNGNQTGKNMLAVVANTSAQKGFMNGITYQGLEADLQSTPKPFAKVGQSALNVAKDLFMNKTGIKPDVRNSQTELIVYVDKSNKAHWAYHVSFDVAETDQQPMPHKPNYILDATTFKVYEQWDNIQTDLVNAGGFGGNPKQGRLSYDGTAANLPSFKVDRKSSVFGGSCAMSNDDVIVFSKKWFFPVGEKFECAVKDNQHNNLYWNGEEDAVNGGYSPENDAMYAGLVIKRMYQDWYGIPVLTDENGKPMMLAMVVHAHMANAYWNGIAMTFGDGDANFYPLTSIDVGAHEISHGFTQQHSNLTYEHQSGGLNESFSDMAAQAGEFYAYGHNNWMIGENILKGDGALRYMDMPSKDCGKYGCSIDDASQYSDSLDVHFTSGVFNRAFYLIATADGWSVRQAFDVMVQANRYYWTSNSDYIGAACGVLNAANDLKYDTTAIKAAFAKVKVDISHC